VQGGIRAPVGEVAATSESIRHAGAQVFARWQRRVADRVVETA
jgi:hypothetical protein